MNNHKKWTMITGYFKNIPIELKYIKILNKMIKEGKNILILIKREDPNSNPKHTQEDKFKEICRLYPKETLKNLIVSSVVDINEIIEC